MLTGNEIIIQQQSGGLKIEPFDPDCVGANSYDVHLAPELLVYTETILDAKHQNRTERLTIPEDGLVLWPHRLYLGRTVEYTETDRFVPMYEGRSSLGRLGVFSHVTAGFGDIGFKGNWTLEIMVIHPIRVYPGMRIGQLFYHRPDGAVVKKYDSDKYQGQTDVMPSRLFMDWRSCVAENVLRTFGATVWESVDICKDCSNDFVKWVRIGVKEDHDES